MQIIGGKFKSRKIITPKGDATRPTSAQMREALFNICQTYIENTVFLDLFAGSGAIGLEALSRGAQHVTFIETSLEGIRCIHTNIEQFNIPESSVKIIHGDVFKWLQKLSLAGKIFDIIFADPPYEIKKKPDTIASSAKVVASVEATTILNKEGDLFVEDSRYAEPLIAGLKQLVWRGVRHMGRSMLIHYQRTS